MSNPTRHNVDWTALGLRRAAADAGVTLPLSYARAVAADGLARAAALALSRLGAGVVIHTAPGERHLPIVIGYADERGQWYRDGRRHRDEPAPLPSGASPTETTPRQEVAL
jgi:hypothetical protein